MFHYSESVPYSSLPVLGQDAFSASIIEKCRKGWRLLGLFNAVCSGRQELVCVLAENPGVLLDTFRCIPGKSIRSITPDCPQAHLFEREIYEQCGIHPQGHPWLKPVRFCPAEHRDRTVRPGPAQTGYYRIEGAEVHEVAVGPIHAGVIEPGHFRFQCYGENVLHLEIQLGFQHRDAEYCLKKAPPVLALPLVENIAGDTAIGHATAYCVLLERLHSVKITRRDFLIRRLALDMIRGTAAYLPQFSLQFSVPPGR